jgi:hypothetical protein
MVPLLSTSLYSNVHRYTWVIKVVANDLYDALQDAGGLFVRWTICRCGMRFCVKHAQKELSATAGYLCSHPYATLAVLYGRLQQEMP